MVWFQALGIKENAKKIGIKAYALKKYPRIIPSIVFHVPPSGSMHLSHLELGDSDFRSPAHIDIVVVMAA